MTREQFWNRHGDPLTHLLTTREYNELLDAIETGVPREVEVAAGLLLERVKYRRVNGPPLPEGSDAMMQDLESMLPRR